MNVNQIVSLVYVFPPKDTSFFLCSLKKAHMLPPLPQSIFEWWKYFFTFSVTTLSLLSNDIFRFEYSYLQVVNFFVKVRVHEPILRPLLQKFLYCKLGKRLHTKKAVHFFSLSSSVLHRVFSSSSWHQVFEPVYIFATWTYSSQKSEQHFPKKTSLTAIGCNSI